MSPATREILTQLAVVLTAAAAGGGVAWLAPRFRHADAPDRSRARAPVLLGLATAAFAALFAYLANRKFDCFGAAAVDFGIQHHVFWAGGRGGFLYQTVILGKPHLNHVALVTQLLSPLSVIFPSPRTLLIMQAAALASAAIPAYLLARTFTASRYLALAFGISLLLLVPFQSLALYDFHERTYAPALLLWAMWGVETKRPRFALLFFFFAVLLLEELSLYVAAAGVFLALGTRWRRLGLTTATFAAVYFLAATYLVYPQLMDLHGGSSNPILNTFGVASSPGGLVRYAATYPADFFGRARDAARIGYLVHMFAPWGLLSAAAGWGWLTYATPLIYAFFSQVPNHYDVNFQYALPFIPFLFYFATRTWGWLERRGAARPALLNWGRRAMTGYLVLAGLGTSYYFGPLGKKYNATYFTPPRGAADFPRVARLVSKDRSLAASMFLLPHFTERWRAYLFPHQFQRHRFLLPYEVLVGVSDLETGYLEENWLTPGPWEWDTGWRRITLIRLLRDKRYGCVYADGDYVLLRRGAKPQRYAADVFEILFRVVEDYEGREEVGARIYDPRARDGRAIYCRADQGRYGTMTRAARYWPPGIVRVKYRLAAANISGPFARVAELVVVKTETDGSLTPVATRTVLGTEFPAEGGYTWFPVGFESTGLNKYQFLLYNEGAADLYFDHFYVEAPTLTLEQAFNPTRSASEKEALAGAAAELAKYLTPSPPGYHLRH